MQVGLEREAKLGAWTGFRLPDLEGVSEGITARSVPERKLESTYYDTHDLRLARWGVSVRFRTGDGTGWTVKLAEGEEGPALARRELTFGAKQAGTVPAEVADLLLAYVRSSSLVPAARLRTRRNGVELLDAEGQKLAEVVDDEVSVFEGRRLASRFRELEVEVESRASRGLLDEVLTALHAAGAGPVDLVPKVVRALGARANAPPELVEDDLGDEATAGDVIQRAITASVIRILRHDAGVRIGDDPEDVHQARVGTRRLRSDLKTFESLIEPEWLTELVEELRWLGGALGAVRDADVLLERLRQQVASLPETDASGAATLVRRLVRQREEARDTLLVSMSEPRYVEILDRLVDAAHSPSLQPEADQKASVVLPSLVCKPWKKLNSAVKALPGDPPDEALHDVRIKAKRVRYAAEAVSPVIGKKAKAFASAVAGLQGVLGDHQDAVVAEDWLRDAARGSGVSKLVAGELIGLQRFEAETCRQGRKRAWKKARDPGLRKWLT